MLPDIILYLFPLKTHKNPILTGFVPEPYQIDIKFRLNPNFVFKWQAFFYWCGFFMLSLHIKYLFLIGTHSLVFH